jgi:tRNA-dihydrouridine synthase B
MNCSIPKHSIFLAPMEGHTDPLFREVMGEEYNHWDYFSTDFLRIPKVGGYPLKLVQSHFGEKLLKNEKHRDKTFYQVLCSQDDLIEDTIGKIKMCNIDKLDLNLGCPSRKVNSHRGGAYLLEDLPALKKILKTIRKNFPLLFTAKIRVGYRDDKNFSEILKTIEGEGVDAIFIHGRTRDQLYKGRANWDYIKQATETVSVPVIGNGDIWTLEDIISIYQETDCHAVMVGRGALKTPWLAKLYQQYVKDNSRPLPSPSELLEIRNKEIPNYLNKIQNKLLVKLEGQKNMEKIVLKRMKSLLRYLFEDLPNGSQTKSSLLRAQTLENFNKILDEELLQ